MMIVTTSLSRVVNSLRSKPIFTPFILPKLVRGSQTTHRYYLQWHQQIFVALEDYGTSLVSFLIGVVVQGSVLTSTILGILSTVPAQMIQPDHCLNPVCHNDVLCPGVMVCEPVEAAVFDEIQKIILIILTIDYGVRILLVAFVPPRLSHILPKDWDRKQLYLWERSNGTYEMLSDPDYTPLYRLFLYVVSPFSIVDMVSIVPPFVDLLLGNSHRSNSFFIRLFRIFRIFRVIKLSRSGSGAADDTGMLLIRTLKSSFEALTLFALFALIAVILFGTIQYTLEGGEFEVTEEFPNGVYMTPSASGFTHAPSNFRSIPASIYWAAITMATVGYGDLTPTTGAGRAVASILALIGTLMLAMPVTVIGHFFSRDYDIYVAEKKASRLRKELAMMESWAVMNSSTSTMMPMSVLNGSPSREDDEEDMYAALMDEQTDSLTNSESNANAMSLDHDRHDAPVRPRLLSVLSKPGARSSKTFPTSSLVVDTGKDENDDEDRDKFDGAVQATPKTPGKKAVTFVGSEDQQDGQDSATPSYLPPERPRHRRSQSLHTPDDTQTFGPLSSKTDVSMRRELLKLELNSIENQIEEVMKVTDHSVKVTNQIPVQFRDAGGANASMKSTLAQAPELLSEILASSKLQRGLSRRPTLETFKSIFRPDSSQDMALDDDFMGLGAGEGGIGIGIGRGIGGGAGVLSQQDILRVLVKVVEDCDAMSADLQNVMAHCMAEHARVQLQAGAVRQLLGSLVHMMASGQVMTEPAPSPHMSRPPPSPHPKNKSRSVSFTPPFIHPANPPPTDVKKQPHRPSRVGEDSDDEFGIKPVEGESTSEVYVV